MRGSPGQTVADEGARFPGPSFEAERSGSYAAVSFGAGARLGRAVVLGVLSQTHRAVLYRAVDLRSGLDLVIKTLDPRLNGSERALARFEREIRLSTTLQHPNLLRATDAGVVDGIRYLTGEYLPRGTLEGALPDGRRDLPLQLVGDWLRQLAEGLEYLHGRTIVHGDLEPANILLGAGPRRVNLKITDFGPASDPLPTRFSALDSRLGTPNYMSPEQVRGQAPTPATDVYALGCLAFRLLTDELPYPLDDPNAVATAHLHATVPELVRSGLPRPFKRLVAAMLAKTPSKRPNMTEVLDALALLA